MNAHADPSSSPPETYWSFISYRHIDNHEPGREWGTWLHRTLEHYEVPTDLVDRPNEREAPIPKSLYPIFRDEEELAAGTELPERIKEALRHSRTLTVICSPRAVESQWIADEILEFKRLGRSHAIFIVLIDGRIDAERGEPGYAIPEELRYKINPKTGELSSEREPEPLVVDLRSPDGSEGWTSSNAYRAALMATGEAGNRLESSVDDYDARLELGRLRLIAGILGVRLNVLRRRDALYQEEKRKRLERSLRRTLAAFMTSPLIVATLLVSYYRLDSKLSALPKYSPLSTFAKLVQDLLIIDIVGGTYVLTCLLAIYVAYAFRESLLYAHRIWLATFFVLTAAIAYVAMDESACWSTRRGNQILALIEAQQFNLTKNEDDARFALLSNQAWFTQTAVEAPNAVATAGSLKPDPIFCLAAPRLPGEIRNLWRTHYRRYFYISVTLSTCIGLIYLLFRFRRLDERSRL